MATTERAENGERSIMQRILSLFAEVTPKEVFTVLLLTLNVFLLLTAYYLLKVVREPLILASGGAKLFGVELGGAELKNFAAAGQAGLLILVVRVYGAMAKRFGRMPLTTALNLFFASNLVIFYVLAQLKVPLGLAFFVWVGCFSLTVLAQFWSFANDIYTPEQGKRLFAIVGVGSSGGAVAGAKIADLIIAPIGPYNMMLVAAAVLVLCLGIFYIVHRHEIARPGVAAASADKPPGGTRGGFSIVAHDRYLLLIAALAILLNWVNTTGEYILDSTLVDTASSGLVAPSSPGPEQAQIGVGSPVYVADRDASRIVAGTVAAVSPDGYRVEAEGRTFENAGTKTVFARTKEGQDDALKLIIGSFKASYFLWVNIFGVVVQLFLVSRIFKYLGLRFALFILPSIALLGYAALAFAPILAVVRVAKIAENTTDYSVQNTARQALFLPVSREAKYAAKAAIDTFMQRAGDVLSAVLVAIGTAASFATQNFAMVNLCLVVVWLFIVAGIAREHRKRTADEHPEPVAKAA